MFAYHVDFIVVFSDEFFDDMTNISEREGEWVTTILLEQVVRDT